MSALIKLCIFFAIGLTSIYSGAQAIIELDTTTIKGNTELPKTMYVVPWQDRIRKNDSQQKLVLHNLYSDLFDPVMPNQIQEGKPQGLQN